MISTRITEDKTTYISSDEETYSMKKPNVFPSIKHALLDADRYESFNTQTSSFFNMESENEFQLIMRTIKNGRKAENLAKNSMKQHIKQQILDLVQ